MSLSWMAWTTPTALFFIALAAALVIMIIWSVKAPQQPRHGILRIETTPGDRLFITLLGSAFLCLGWLGVYGSPVWGGLLVSLLYGISVFRWV